uniref:UTP--glucose-1-phosphate uridylyltransferase n=1 Tax=Strongyloides stercoralis TaxID=6248 RepID=A0A0K0EPH3_STRER
MEHKNVDKLMILMEEKLSQLCHDDVSKNDMKIFRNLYYQFLTEPSLVNWDEIKNIKDEIKIDYNDLADVNGMTEVKEVLSKVAVIKLNGGLGTTMGCKGPKSLIPVKEGKTFLEIAVLQNKALNSRYGSNVPVYLLNSFNTEREIENFKHSMRGKIDFKVFNQSKCPRIFEDTLMPVPSSYDDCNDEAWYPPGHGNILHSLVNTGIIDNLLKEGREIAFISNIDNTGAYVDIKIAKTMVDDKADYIMEVTDKTTLDTKGGTLIEINDHIMHLEMPQVPKNHIDDFCSLNKFKIFNTNNIWINLRKVKEKIDTIKMEIIVNKKKLKNGRNVIQLETSIGGAIRNFERSLAVHVDRHRFLPVKKTQDLMGIMSNLYTMDENFILRLVENRPIKMAPTIKLSSEFDYVSEFQKRMPNIPNIKDLIRLTIKGDVTFGKDVTLKGDVIIVADKNSSLHITQGSVIENKLCRGSFEIFEN